jgi:hypothetical protein
MAEKEGAAVTNGDPRTTTNPQGQPGDEPEGFINDRISSPPTSPQADAAPSWEDRVEHELVALRREVEWLKHELIKQGGRVNVLFKERDAARSRGRQR